MVKIKNQMSKFQSDPTINEAGIKILPRQPRTQNKVALNARSPGS